MPTPAKATPNPKAISRSIQLYFTKTELSPVSRWGLGGYICQLKQVHYWQVPPTPSNQRPLGR